AERPREGVRVLTEGGEGVWTRRSEVLRNTTAVVRGRDGVLVVDAGVTGAEMAWLAGDVRRLGQPIVAGFSTHPDWDHVLWHADLGDAPRYGTARCANFLGDLLRRSDWKQRAAESLPPEVADVTPLALFGRVTGLPAGTTRLPWDGPTVRIIEHPAHAPGHAALLVEARGVLVAGDMLSDLFVPMLDDVKGDNDPVGEYLTGLRLLESVADDVDVIVPGHGSVCGADQVRTRFDLDRVYVETLRDGGDFDDPRIGSSVEPGWEWVNDIHEGQLRSHGRGAG